jgi:hypothetical protein
VVTVLESTYANTHYRPAGPATHDEAFAYLVDELRWSQQFADELASDRLSKCCGKRRRPRRLPISIWSELLEAGKQFRVAGDALRVVDRLGSPAAGPAEVIALLVKAARGLEQAILRAGRTIVEPVPPPVPAGNPAGFQPDAVAGILADALPSQTDLADVELDHIIALARTAEWIDHVSRALKKLAAPLDQQRTIAGRPWWQ